ncbi:hypothetical protein CO057_03330 [Candidatus Uhrbacteria bacterium CG_4_9_14_0_2_um_filter_41_50]|uniref:Glycosyltransferase family 1 protein n=1 Tax=Candidatus Uhrbacteria bacterium CG_4_9_14_0_2_um_filter_41_50 TaxID=1975031 RepID=A0A2M8ENS0_9BACT|nr:MAG: hypothetical protein COZ45_03540 [Candidatus Uhrbacteria bacterium CG_4_10_14_3_um_filter_41_21]PIZ55106.1 MAG: hypothetical protein COY24_01585 [Candidatus Uhrbacteria bacterium CG_4_10_14_0_2_um_filter_41_21]PJB84436.1 MAG: hypothetical protein CO086_03710 [Candidatus Uhrbacteria bacterium CG_4_9_14_0_8_um_filter_41_16]PJC24331.1 MAG: hypothetical protein CO057_03330 [Candidatus Uhrbacteria bacterium CG_4_9_14_0_2_um_filter_41_50]PJE75306.1 MAG: hypothetical protein COV03_00875 [Candi
MKIAQVTPIYPPAPGGMGKVAEDYTLAFRAAGHEVDVFFPDKYPGIFKHGHAAIVPSFLWKLRSYDVIHLHFPFYGSDHFIALASLIWKTPLVITYHMKNQGSGFLRFLFLVHKLWEWFVMWRASAVLVSSLDYARSVKLKHKNLISMPFWIDTEKFHSEGKIESRNKLGISINQIVFLFVGALDQAHYFKGVDILLNACSKLRLDNSWQLIIVGDGNLKVRFEDLARAKNLEKKVLFTGKVSDKDLPDYYRAADIHILPAIDRSEAFGLVTLEAAASGKASVVSDLPGVRTLVEHQKTGLVIPVNDAQALVVALTWLVQHKDKISEFGQNARKMAVDKYSKQIILQKLQQIYKGGKV